MPVACGNTVLTGDSGSVAFTPAGTSVCLLDYTDFPTADPGLIQLPAGHGFLVGDVVQFSVEGGATLVTGLTADTDYYIIAIDGSRLRPLFLPRPVVLALPLPTACQMTRLAVTST